MGVNPFDEASWQRSAASQAVWWAGPAIGLFNLLPLLPLDGGNVVASLLERWLPGRARRTMLYASLVITIGAAIWVAVRRQLRSFTVFLGLLVVMQLQMFFDDRTRQAVSPFDKALAALRAGDPERATRTLVNGLRRPGRPASCRARSTTPPPDSCWRLLPRPLPVRRPLQRVRAGQPAPANRRVRRGRPVRRRVLRA